MYIHSETRTRHDNNMQSFWCLYFYLLVILLLTLNKLMLAVFNVCTDSSDADNRSSGGWIRVAAVSSAGGWIQVTADSILRLTRVAAARHELRLTPSHGWLKFRWLDMGCGWLRPTADSSSCGLIRVAADSILQLATSRDWLEFSRLDSICGCFIL